MKTLRRRRSAPSFVNVLDTFFNDDFLKKIDEGLTVWNGSAPAVNVKEDADAFNLEMAAPGYEKGDFNILVEEDVLTISTTAKGETEPKEGEKYTRKEFKYGSFKRTFNLPDTVDSTKIAANYTNGILTLSIPKKEEAKPLPARTIEIG